MPLNAAPRCDTGGPGPVGPQPMTITVSIARQMLRLADESGRVVRDYPCSTSKFGTGSESGSHRTPTGKFRIVRKIGQGAEAGTIFRSRVPVGLWRGEESAEDHVLSRILWLDGMEPHNASTIDRYIYIHGTNQESLIGTPASHGCVRLTNAAVIDLFQRVPEGTEVEILNDEAPH